MARRGLEETGGAIIAVLAVALAAGVVAALTGGLGVLRPAVNRLNRRLVQLLDDALWAWAGWSPLDQWGELIGGTTLCAASWATLLTLAALLVSGGNPGLSGLFWSGVWGALLGAASRLLGEPALGPTADSGGLSGVISYLRRQK